MDFTSYVYVGLGVAVSVLGFFLKRLKEEVDVVKARNARLEINQARNFEKIANLEKITEDRREDIKRLYEVINKKCKNAVHVKGQRNARRPGNA